jgi:hypothetical protein
MQMLALNPPSHAPSGAMRPRRGSHRSAAAPKRGAVSKRDPRTPPRFSLRLSAARSLRVTHEPSPESRVPTDDLWQRGVTCGKVTEPIPSVHLFP